MDDEHEFIVIGSGAGGAAAAWHLAQSGKPVLLLEKGERLPRDASTLDPAVVLDEGRYKSRESWTDGGGRVFAPEEYFNLGGKTKWYGAALLRFGEDEFAADAACGFLPCPIGYDELAPYYAQIESLFALRRFEIEPGLHTIAASVARGGWHSTPLALGLSPEILVHRDEATHFDGFASTLGLKADAESCLLARVADAPNLRTLTGAAVVELLPAPSARRVAGVRCADGRTYRADRILLAAGALHSPRLLERYLATTGLNAQLPGARLVGRYYKRHVLTAVLAFGVARQRDLLRKTALFTHARYPRSSVQPLGGWIDREIVAREAPRLAPRALTHALGERVYGFFLQTEDGSHADNRVLADDGAGRPRLDYDLARLPGAAAEHSALVRGFRRTLLRAGRVSVAQRVGLAGSAHSCGTLVAGDDPRQSVVDRDGRVHGMENLYVVDGSVLPRSSRMNPALTIYAWSLRVAAALA